MKKQTRATLFQQVSARWLVFAYMLSIFLGAIPPSIATRDYIPGLDSVLTEQSNGDPPPAPEQSETEMAPPISQEGSVPEVYAQDSGTSEDTSDQGNTEEDPPSEIATDPSVAVTMTMPNHDDIDYIVGVKIKHYNNNALVEINSNTCTLTVNGTGTPITVDAYRQQDSQGNYDGFLAVVETWKATISSNDVVTLSFPASDFGNNYDKITLDLGGYDPISNFPLEYTPNPITFTATGTTTINAALDQTHTSTQETSVDFEGQGGIYNLLYLLNNYNAVSFTDIGGTHIIGPIIALGEAKRTAKQPTGRLEFSDRSKGISSYIGEINANSSDPTLSNVSAQYTYDFDENTFTSPTEIPNLYIPLTNYFVMTQGTSHQLEYVATGSTAFQSPQYSGLVGKVWQNDSFMDSAKLKQAVTTYGSDLLWNGEKLTGGSFTSTPLSTTDYDDYPTDTIVRNQDQTSGNYLELEYKGDGGTITALKLDHGEHYTIEAGTYPEHIIIDFGELKYSIDTDTKPTTINFEAGSLLTSTNGYTLFPTIYVKDGQFTNAYKLPTPLQGKDGEYSDLGNKVLWNLDKVIGNMAFYDTSPNLFGQFIAPNADIRNYASTGSGTSWAVNTSSLNGGNINGAVIANSIDMGESEFHLWPYMDNDEEEAYYSTSAILKGTKEITGFEGSTDTFYFTLTDTKSSAWSTYQLPDENTPTQKDHYSLPETTTVSTSGAKDFSFEKISFHDLAESTHETYIFYVYEDSSKGKIANVDYDTTVYGVAVSVEIVNNQPRVTSTVTAYYADGTSSADVYTQDVDNLGIVFVNEYEQFDLPETGGSGTMTYTLVGIGLMSLALFLPKTNRKETFL